jgi:hypothetical protein
MPAEETKRDYNRKPGSEIQGSYRLTKSEATRLAALLESIGIKPTRDNIKKVVRWLITQFDQADPEDIKRLFLSEYPKYDMYIRAMEKAAIEIAHKRHGEETIKTRGAIQLDLLRKVSEFAVVEDAVMRGEQPIQRLHYTLTRVLYYAALEYLYDRDEAVFNAIVARYATRAGLTEEEALAAAVATIKLLASQPADWRKNDLEGSYREECEVLEAAILSMRQMAVH